jgi:hypothetical protein
VIQLDRGPGVHSSACVRDASDDELAGLRDEFRHRHAVVVPGLFGAALLAEVQAELDRAPFEQRDYDGLAGELALDESVPLVARLLFLVNDPSLYRTVESITGARPVVRFDGRIYRRVATPEHYDNWHDDLEDLNHLVTMSVNLGSEPYGGGVLHMRRKGTHEPVAEVHNTGPGDALFFRIAPDLQHRVESVTAGVKTALAGWFSKGSRWPLPARRL